MKQEENKIRVSQELLEKVQNVIDNIGVGLVFEISEIWEEYDGNALIGMNLTPAFPDTITKEEINELISIIDVHDVVDYAEIIDDDENNILDLSLYRDEIK